MTSFFLRALPALLLLFWGCAHPGLSPEGDMPAPEALYGSLSSDPAPGKSLTGILNISVRVPQNRWVFKMAAAARMPDRLRLEDLSVIGLPDFVLTVSGEDVRMILPRSGEFLTGAESAERLRKLFPPSIGPTDVIALLYGRPPALRNPTLKGQSERGRYRIDAYSGGTWRQSLWIDPASGLLQAAEIADRSGVLSYRARFQDPLRTEGPAVPGRIEIETADEAVRISIRTSDVEWVSKENDPEFFLLQPPVREPAS